MIQWSNVPMLDYCESLILQNQQIFAPMWASVFDIGASVEGRVFPFVLLEALREMLPNPKAENSWRKTTLTEWSDGVVDGVPTL